MPYWVSPRVASLFSRVTFGATHSANHQNLHISQDLSSSPQQHINIKTSLRAPGQRPLRTISIPDKRLSSPDLLPDIESSLFYFMISNPAMMTDQQ
ncbi:uncharacterized protein RSE6_13939 [Rhynchosporium secalis]|uniref:Uncharacterized protein n=1 Tax=Rhynchosporium secalis TaxID=38038 RepID=A0A1E1MU42_RHYSE|nr:uncharacterized protein RSE6_13939 [Rhynchosporium secalis]